MLGVEKKLISKYVTVGQLRIVFNPVINHGNYSHQAHQGAECAAEQGKFWFFREVLYRNQHRIWKRNAAEIVKLLAAESQLHVDEFYLCMDEQRYAGIIDGQDALRKRNGVRLQPTFDINGQRVVGMAMFQTLDAIIQEELSK